MKAAESYTHKQTFLAGLMNNILVTAICGLCATNVFASQGCTIKYQDGRTADKVVYAFQDVSGDVFLLGMGDKTRPLGGTYSYNNKVNHFSKLKSVNGTNIVAPSQPDKNTAKYIFFSCDKFSNDSYFGYDCKDGYKGGTYIGTVSSIGWDHDIYDQCIESDGGCTLKFKDETIFKHVVSGGWWYNGKIFIRDVEGNYFDDKNVEDIVSVNNENVSISFPDDAEETTSVVRFKCDKWSNGKYFAFGCRSGYYGGTELGDYNYDKCVKTESGLTEQDSDNSETSTETVSKPKTASPKSRQTFDFNQLDSFIDMYFDPDSATVWRDENGKFNTARLVSDSVAGVILGTVGGVVTSKIIKKNQIKNGFQDLKCTIGGKDVATYGDEFNVGIK